MENVGASVILGSRMQLLNLPSVEPKFAQCSNTDSFGFLAQCHRPFYSACTKSRVFGVQGMEKGGASAILGS